MSRQRSSNPFLDDEEKDVQKPRDVDPIMDRRQQLYAQIDASEDRQVDTTRRILGSIYESEQIGVDTAEELQRQGEQLDRIEENVTTIDKNLTTSQRHLNSIKSVFGGIKNWWTSKKDDPSAPRSGSSAITRSDRGPSGLQQTKPENRHNTSHPALRLKSEDCKGFYEEDEDDLNDRFMKGAKSPQGPIIQKVTNSAREEEIDRNLGLMSDGMTRLKSLALNLGDEIERQNDQLDRITPHMDKVNLKLENQQKQMGNILRK